MIDQASEIVIAQWALGAHSDMAALREILDTNHNGLLDSGDGRWSDFRVWRDGSGEGSQVGELQSLDAMGHRVHRTESACPSAALTDGSVVQGLANFTRTDGSVGAAGDVSLAYQGGTEQSGHDDDGVVTKRLIGLHGDTAAVRSVLAAQRQFVIDFNMTPSEIGAFCDRGRDAAKNADLEPLPKDATKQEREERLWLLQLLAQERTQAHKKAVNCGLIAEEIETRLAGGFQS